MESKTLNVHARSPSANKGDQFTAYITSMNLADRENAIYDEVPSDYVPGFMQTLQPASSSYVISSTDFSIGIYILKIQNYQSFQVNKIAIQ